MVIFLESNAVVRRPIRICWISTLIYWIPIVLFWLSGNTVLYRTNRNNHVPEVSRDKYPHVTKYMSVIACLMNNQKLLNRVSHGLPRWTLEWFTQLVLLSTVLRMLQYVICVNLCLLTVWLISMIFERIFPSLIRVRIFRSSSVAIRSPIQRRDTTIFATSLTLNGSTSDASA